MIFHALLLGLASNPRLPVARGVDGANHDLRIEAKGRPIALVFISHDCPVCNTYAPELARIASVYAGRVVFALVYAEPNVDHSIAESHGRAYGLLRVERLLDPSGRLATAAGATITPQAAVFDGSGRRAYLGRIDDLYYDLGKQRPAAQTHDLRRALDAVLAHKTATPASGPPFGCVIETTARP